MAQNIAGSIRTDVTADTSQFDSAMKRAADAMEASVSRMNASRKKLDVAGMMSKAAVRPSPELAGVDPGAISVGVGVFGALHSTQARQHAASEASARSHAEVMLKVQAELSRGQYAQLVKERQQIESEYARSRAELLADLKADIQQRLAVESAAAAAERGLLTAQRQEMETHAQSLRNIQMAMLKEDIQSRFAHAAQSKSIRDNDWNDEREQLRQMAALRVDIIARGEDAALREMLQADVESRVMRDNEHNDIMAKLRQEAAFREDLRTRLAPGRNMTSLMSQRNTSDSIVTGMSSAGKEQRRYTEQLEQQLEREERVRRARVLDLKQREREQDIAAERAMLNQQQEQQVAAEREERVRRARVLDLKQREREQDIAAERAMLNQQQAQHRAALEQQVAAERAAAERRIQIQNDAIRVNRRRYANDTIQAIRDANNRRIESRQFRPNANMSDDMDRAASMVKRLRGELDPLVGIQQNIAQRAMEYRREMMGAVIAGRMNNTEAQKNIAAYDVLLNQLRQRNEAEHRSFLGMRRMGFAAQQFGYAIEDAASQYGTMGLAGAFRAAGNNLTAMAATMGVTAGVTASLVAAAVSLGIAFYNANDALKIQEQLAKKRKEQQDQYNQTLRETLEIINRIREVRERELEFGRLNSIGGQSGFLEQMNNEVSQAEAMKTAEAFTSPIDAAQKRLDELRQMRERFGMSGFGGGVLDFIGHYTGAGTLEESRLELTKKIAQAEVELAVAVAARTAEEVKSAALGIVESQKRVKQREEIVRMSEQMFATQRSEIRMPTADTEIALRRQLLQLEIDRETLLTGVYATETELNQGIAEATRLLEDQLKIEERIAALKKQQADATRDAAEMVRASYSRRNDQFAFEEKQRKDAEAFQKEMDKSTGGVDMTAAANDKFKEYIVWADEVAAVSNKLTAAWEPARRENRTLTDEERTQVDALQNERNELIKKRSEARKRWEEAQRLSDLPNAFKVAQDAEKQIRDNELAITAKQDELARLEGQYQNIRGIPTVMSATTRGDESRRMIEQEKLRLRSQGEQEPMVKAIGQVKDEIRKLREDNKQIQSQTPPVAAMF